jgi:putative membrane protein
LHDVAGRGGWPFAAEQLSFLAAGLGLWSTAFACRSRAAAGAAAITLFFTFAHMTMFGLVLTLSPALLYDPQLCQGVLGLDPLNDQHMGGVLMAVGAALPYLIATAAAVGRALAGR